MGTVEEDHRNPNYCFNIVLVVLILRYDRSTCIPHSAFKPIRNASSCCYLCYIFYLPVESETGKAF